MTKRFTNFLLVPFMLAIVLIAMPASAQTARVTGQSSSAAALDAAVAAREAYRLNPSESNLQAAMQAGNALSAASPRVTGGNLTSASVAVVGGPVNDNWEAATLIPAAPFVVSGSNIGATDQGIPSACSSGGNALLSIWWKFTPASDGILSMNTAGTVRASGSGLPHTILSIHEMGNPSVELACGNYLSPGGQFSSLDYPVLGGTTYLIRVAIWWENIIESLDHATIQLNGTLELCPTVNLALGKPGFGSNFEPNYAPEFALDGDINTRWGTWPPNDPEFFTVDLGGWHTLCKVVIYWETAYGADYDIQLSDDNINWTTVKEVRGGTGGTPVGPNTLEEVLVGFPPTLGRYVRMYGYARGTPYGYSAWEFEVYGEFFEDADDDGVLDTEDGDMFNDGRLDVKSQVFDDLLLASSLCPMPASERLSSAAWFVNASLDPANWVNPSAYELDPELGRDVFDYEYFAGDQLEEAVELLGDAELAECRDAIALAMAEMIAVDQLIAQAAIDNATAICANPECLASLALANSLMAGADDWAASLDLKLAIDKYGDAWEAAMEALENVVAPVSPSGATVDGTGALGTGTETDATIPTTVVLAGNYPNPFNPSTTIQFGLPEAMNTRLVVFDLMGREIAVLVDGLLPAGMHEAGWDAGDLTSGTYLYRLVTPTTALTGRFVLLK